MKHLVRHLVSRLPWGRKETPGMKRMRETFELIDLGIAMRRQRMRNENPQATEDEIDAMVRAWRLEWPHEAPQPHISCHPLAECKHCGRVIVKHGPQAQQSPTGWSHGLLQGGEGPLCLDGRSVAEPTAQRAAEIAREWPEGVR